MPHDTSKLRGMAIRRSEFHQPTYDESVETPVIENRIGGIGGLGSKRYHHGTTESRQEEFNTGRELPGKTSI